VGSNPPGPSHQALATFLETQGADAVLLSSSVAYWNRRTQEETWGKHARKNAANCAALLEQGKVLFYSQPTGPLAELRHLVKWLRRARTELAACQAWERTAPGRPAKPKGRLPLGLATAWADLGAQGTAVQARIAALEATLTPLAARLPAYALLRTIPGAGAPGAAVLLTEIGDIAWFP
jgi:hypothetical protein